MQALLGRITHITQKDETASVPGGAAVLEVKFKPACVLPRRTKVPEWLKDQSLTLKRVVADPREVGRPGDSLVLTPAESVGWLAPLVVTPDVAYGEPPQTLRLRLRWWKEEKAPEFAVRANGRSLSGTFTKEGDGYTAEVATASFWDAPPALPVAIEVTCDRMTVACTVVPREEAYVRKLLLPEGERYRIENAWYAVDITTQNHAGAILALREKGRRTDHFRRPEQFIQDAVEYAGHSDRFRMGWDWAASMQDAKVTCAGARREGGATRLELEGVVDEGQHLRTTVTCLLYDGLPLLLLEREFRFGKGKEPEAKEKEEKPREPIDDLKPVGLGFRAAWIAERNGNSGSRLLCADGRRLVATRCAQVGEFIWHHYWRMEGGWAVAEHPRRREHMMYLFDTATPPRLATWMDAHTITLEPHWPSLPVRPEESIGYTLAITAGELCGASAEGAWVACRLPTTQGACAAVVARLRDASAAPTASFTLGGATREAPLRETFVPGVGPVLYATVEFPGGGMEDAFDVTVAGIPPRRDR